MVRVTCCVGGEGVNTGAEGCGENVGVLTGGDW